MRVADVAVELDRRHAACGEHRERALDGTLYQPFAVDGVGSCRLRREDGRRAVSIDENEGADLVTDDGDAAGIVVDLIHQVLGQRCVEPRGDGRPRRVRPGIGCGIRGDDAIPRQLCDTADRRVRPQ